MTEREFHGEAENKKRYEDGSDLRLDVIYDESSPTQPTVSPQTTVYTWGIHARLMAQPDNRRQNVTENFDYTRATYESMSHVSMVLSTLDGLK